MCLLQAEQYPYKEEPGSGIKNWPLSGATPELTSNTLTWHLVESVSLELDESRLHASTKRRPDASIEVVELQFPGAKSLKDVKLFPYDVFNGDIWYGNAGFSDVASPLKPEHNKNSTQLKRCAEMTCEHNGNTCTFDMDWQWNPVNALMIKHLSRAFYKCDQSIGKHACTVHILLLHILHIIFFINMNISHYFNVILKAMVLIGGRQLTKTFENDAEQLANVDVRNRLNGRQHDKKKGCRS